MGAFIQVVNLVKSQKKKSKDKPFAEAFSGLELDLSCIELLKQAYFDMGVGQGHEYKIPWSVDLEQSKGTIDEERLYSSLRKLSDEDILKIRCFNRFVGHQLYNLTFEEFLEHQDSRNGIHTNHFYQCFTNQSASFAKLFDKKINAKSWPVTKLTYSKRKPFMRIVDNWNKEMRALPGLRIADSFFKNSQKDIYNSFFHLQRQFDAPDYKDLDDSGLPNPQPLPRITTYRQALLSLQNEFNDVEERIAKCFDLCHSNIEAIIPFVLNTEEALLSITSRLDDEYPTDLDYSHQQLHKRSQETKMMLFPLRCLFFDELEQLRSSQESTDNTLDSYLDMTLAKSNVHLPPTYRQNFICQELEQSLQAQLASIYGKPLPHSWDTTGVVKVVQRWSIEKIQSESNTFSHLCKHLEEKAFTDDSINLRIARMITIYLKALAKKEVMGEASLQRLQELQGLSNSYQDRALRFESADTDETADLRQLKDEQLPLMASPQQLEDLYKTSHVVGRLVKAGEDFKEQAMDIEKGLNAALVMMKKAGELMERMVSKMFSKNEDRRDLQQAINSLLKLGYETQTHLANLSKKRSLSKHNSANQNELISLQNKVDRCKKETRVLQDQLREVLVAKNELVDRMRITTREKELYQNQLRMITVMAINSIQSQST
jgi:hypothetical protein